MPLYFDFTPESCRRTTCDSPICNEQQVCFPSSIASKVTKDFRYKREAYRSSEFAARVLAQHGLRVLMKVRWLVYCFWASSDPLERPSCAKLTVLALRSTASLLLWSSRESSAGLRYQQCSGDYGDGPPDWICKGRYEENPLARSS